MPSEQPGEQEYVAPTYLLTNLPEFIDSITYRMLADGMLLPDCRRRGRRWSTGASGVRSGWSGLRRTRRLGMRLWRPDTKARQVSTSSRADCAHYGQFLLWAFPDQKRRAVERKVALYQRAAPLLSPPARPLAIPFGEVECRPSCGFRVARGRFPARC